MQSGSGTRHAQAREPQGGGQGNPPPPRGGRRGRTAALETVCARDQLYALDLGRIASVSDCPTAAAFSDAASSATVPEDRRGMSVESLILALAVREWDRRRCRPAVTPTEATARQLPLPSARPPGEGHRGWVVVNDEG